jgi:hypothetical protein
MPAFSMFRYSLVHTRRNEHRAFHVDGLEDARGIEQVQSIGIVAPGADAPGLPARLENDSGFGDGRGDQRQQANRRVIVALRRGRAA